MSLLQSSTNLKPIEMKPISVTFQEKVARQCIPSIALSSQSNQYRGLGLHRLPFPSLCGQRSVELWNGSLSNEYSDETGNRFILFNGLPNLKR